MSRMRFGVVRSAARAAAEVRCLFLVFAGAGVVCATPPASDGALAKAAGGSGFSGTLSNNPAVRKQQLTCDPPPADGSTSVEYPSATVSLSAFRYGPGYALPAGQNSAGQVEVRSSDEPPFLIPIEQWVNPALRPPGAAETGYVRVQYQLQEAPGRIPPDPGYSIISVDAGVTGTEGVDTHALFFDLRDGLPLETVAAYRIYASDGSQNRPQDFLRETAGGVQIPAASIAGARVSGPFPEPSSLCVMGTAALGLLGRRRRGRR